MNAALLLASAAWAGTAPAREAGAPAWSLAVEADQVRIVQGFVEGEGHVRIAIDGHLVDAGRFRYDPVTGILVVDEGLWSMGTDARLVFDHAEYDLGSEGAVVVHGRYEGGDLRAWGDRVEVVGPDHLKGDNVTVTACGCDPAPWSVSARHVDVVQGDVARFTGGWVSVCDRRVLPLPAGAVVLADRRTGLLAPSAGWGRDGLVVGLPVFLKAGRSADLTLEPEWRQERGVRALAEGRVAWEPGQSTLLRAAAGSDGITDTRRGALDVDHAWLPGRSRTALRGQWTSDPEWLADFGGDFLTRAAPWSETRAVAALGTLRAETDLFQATTDVGQKPLSGVFSAEAVRVGPLSMGASGRVDVVGHGYDPGAVQDSLERFGADVHGEVGHDFGPFRLSADGLSTLHRWGDDLPWSESRAGATALVPLWGDLGPLRHLADLGVRAETAVIAGEADVRTPDEVPGPAWAVGPLLSSRWLAVGGVPISATAAVPMTPDGLRPEGQVRLERGPWSARLRADRFVQDGRVTWDDRVVHLAVGAARLSEDAPWGVDPAPGDPLLQVRADADWQLPGVLSEWRAGYAALDDLALGRLLSHGPTLAYHSRCQCLSAQVGATWSADRPVPDLGLRVELR